MKTDKSPLLWEDRLWILALSIAAAVLALHVAHLVLVATISEIPDPLDEVIHIANLFLKPLMLVSIPLVAIPAVLRWVRGRPKRALLVFAMWSLTGLVTLLLLYHWRPQLEEFVNSQVSRYLPSQEPEREIMISTGADTFWRDQWQSGRLFMREAGLMLSGIASICILGVIVGGRGWLSRILITALLTITLVQCVMTGLSRWDFDLFYEGTLFGPLPASVFAAFGLIREDIPSLPFCMAILLSCFALDMHFQRRLFRKTRREECSQTPEVEGGPEHLSGAG